MALTIWPGSYDCISSGLVSLASSYHHMSSKSPFLLYEKLLVSHQTSQEVRRVRKEQVYVRLRLGRSIEEVHDERELFTAHFRTLQSPSEGPICNRTGFKIKVEASTDSIVVKGLFIELFLTFVNM